MHENNPNEYRDNLAKKLKKSREIDKDMAQQYLEKNQGTKEYQDTRSKKLSNHEVSKIESETENLENSILRESEILSKRKENISNLNNELGGEKGIIEISGKMTESERGQLQERLNTLKRRIKEKQDALKHGGNTILDGMWGSSKALMDPTFLYSKDGGELINSVPIFREIEMLTLLVSGIAIGSAIALPAGVQNIIRKIQLGVRQREEKHLSNKMTQS